MSKHNRSLTEPAHGCPDCGGKAHARAVYSLWRCECEKCHLVTGIHSSASAACEAWDRRVFDREESDQP